MDEAKVIRRPLLFAMAALAFTASCAPSYDDQVRALEKAASKPIGTTPDFWLMKFNAAGMWEKTALIFGYWGDEQVCFEVARLYTERYPADRYTCMAAN